VKIICHEPGFLTGSVGSVPFVKGVGHTDSEHMLAYFAEHPERFEVLEDEQTPAEFGPPLEQPDGGTPAPAADAYDELTDEQVADAYATNVGGNHTSRKGQLKALRALDAEAGSDESDEDTDHQE
jgi:hypothetical protein